jgi:hypothetical protein
MARFTVLAGLIGVAFLSTAYLDAAKVKVWQHNNQGHFDRAQFKQAVVSSEGTLRLAKQVKSLANLHSSHVWDVVEDKAGNLIVATGLEGKIFKLAPDGKVDLLYATGDSQVLCLTQAPDGTIFAGTGPRGTVIRIGAGKATVVAENLDMYVWNLAYDPQSKLLFAGTGPRGRIYQIQADGKASVFYTTNQEHVLRLALGSKSTLYAGTDKGGMVYRIDPRGKGFVIFHAPQSEIRTLLVVDDVVYAGTGSPIQRRSGSGSSKTSSTSKSGPLEPQAPGDQRPDDNDPQKGGDKEEAEDKEDSSPNPKPSTTTVSGRTGSVDEERFSTAGGAPAPSQPGAGENSVFRIAADGTVREIFREKVLILSMLKLNGRFLLGTGQQGQVFEVNESSKEKTELVRLDHGQVTCMLKRQNGSIVLGTGDPGKLYVLEDSFVAKGTVISEVLDAKIISKWGALNWRATVPPATTVTVALRSGNVPEPDDTWSDWSAEQTDSQGSKVPAPAARYLQYRVTLATDNSRVSPEVHGMTLRYRTTNQAPEITSFEVPDIDGANHDNPRKLKLHWTAVDPNEDELTYSLFFKKDGWKDWVRLETDLERKDYDWDTTAVPSGIYTLKLVASDRRDNTPEEALTAEKISNPVPIAHDPPRVTVKTAGTEGDQAVIEATATGTLVRLTEASYALNGKKWTNVFPTDGLFDGKNKSFRFKTEGLRPGTYVLVLRVRDAAGNVGSGDVVFTVAARP